MSTYTVILNAHYNVGEESGYSKILVRKFAYYDDAKQFLSDTSEQQDDCFSFEIMYEGFMDVSFEDLSKEEAP